jgi:hypothetical protein
VSANTWVSGVGDDVNPCSRTAPCKTFQGAISKTADGGQINCLDPGGFGVGDLVLYWAGANDIFYFTLGGVPAYVWPGGGITLMVDVARMPEKSFGYVPTPALVAPVEFTLRAADYAALGGYASRAVTLEDVLRAHKVRIDEDGS